MLLLTLPLLLTDILSATFADPAGFFEVQTPTRPTLTAYSVLCKPKAICSVSRHFTAQLNSANFGFQMSTNARLGDYQKVQ
jgi:hypothetical protein